MLVSWYKKKKLATGQQWTSGGLKMSHGKSEKKHDALLEIPVIHLLKTGEVHSALAFALISH